MNSPHYHEPGRPLQGAVHVLRSPKGETAGNPRRLGNESRPANSVKPHICPRVPGGDTDVGADDHPARLRLIKLTRKGGGGILIGRLRGLVLSASCVFECGKGDTVSGNRRQPAGFDGVSSSSEQGMPG